MKNYFEKSEITPTPSEYIRCADMLAQVEDMSPSNANVTAAVSKSPDGSTRALITVHSSWGVFTGEAKGPTLMSSLVQAQHNVLRKLYHWKTTRFPHEEHSGLS